MYNLKLRIKFPVLCSHNRRPLKEEKQSYHHQECLLSPCEQLRVYNSLMFIATLAVVCQTRRTFGGRYIRQVRSHFGCERREWIKHYDSGWCVLMKYFTRLQWHSGGNANNVEVDWQFRAFHIRSPTSPALQGFKLDHFIRSLFSSTSHLCHVALSNYWLHFTIVMRHSEASFSPFPSGHKTHLFPQCFHQHKPQGVLGCHSYCLPPIRPSKFAAKNKFI